MKIQCPGGLSVRSLDSLDNEHLDKNEYIDVTMVSFFPLQFLWVESLPEGLFNTRIQSKHWFSVSGSSGAGRPQKAYKYPKCTDILHPPPTTAFIWAADKQALVRSYHNNSTPASGSTFSCQPDGFTAGQFWFTWWDKQRKKKTTQCRSAFFLFQTGRKKDVEWATWTADKELSVQLFCN